MQLAHTQTRVWLQAEDQHKSKRRGWYVIFCLSRAEVAPGCLSAIHHRSPHSAVHEVFFFRLFRNHREHRGYFGIEFIALKFGTSEYPKDLTFPLMPPEGQSFYLSIEKSEHLHDGLALNSM